MSNQKNYTVRPWPPERGIVVDAGWLGTRRHLIYGLLELDVTNIRRFIREGKASGESLSFTGYMVKCLADAISRHPRAHAYRDWLGRLVIFEDVDVVTMIETEKDGVALPHIIRAANRKSFQEISAEIRAIQSRPKKSEQTRGINKIAPYTPAFIRRAFFKIVLKNPFWVQKFMGTTVVTSVGMFGKGAGWGLGFLPSHTMGITIGGISEKPAYVGGKVEPREFIGVTLTFDHDIIDGAPAARFVNTFKELVEGDAILGIK
jgi:pyruvate/2-oxoglutarate dehydrogenase complex dihydrolipoamide acyltransferase (E2) component